MNRIAIVGGGFSGTLAAINVARLNSRPLAVSLINSGRPVGRGVAYSASRKEHLLNVAARNMAAIPDHPQHFLNWLRTRADFRDTPEIQLQETFAPRRVYGDYLCSLLEQFVHPVRDEQPTALSIVNDRAVGLQVIDHDALEVQLQSGKSLTVDRVLLATGNQTPADVVDGAACKEHPAYCADPWCDWWTRLPSTDKNIVIVGSGLTMVDAFLTLASVGWQGKVEVVSRHGLLPQAHFRGIEYPDFPPENADELGLERLLALMEEHCQRLRESGENPGILVDRLRPYTQRIWRAFSRGEKLNFLSKHVARWNTIRHRIPQPIHQQITEAITEGRVRVHKGAVDSLQPCDDGIRVECMDRKGEKHTLDAGLVINCTGPRSNIAESADPLYRQLLQQGLARPDELDMGIDVGPDFGVIDDTGRPSKNLYAVGPLMVGTLWETTAVPELRGQAMRVAQIMLDSLNEAGAAALPAGSDHRLSVEEEHVIEYYI